MTQGIIDSRMVRGGHGQGAANQVSLVVRLLSVLALGTALLVAALSHEGVADVLGRPVVLAALGLCVAGLVMPRGADR